jgi:hypothetical protein
MQVQPGGYSGRAGTDDQDIDIVAVHYGKALHGREFICDANPCFDESAWAPLLGQAPGNGNLMLVADQ